MRRVLFGVGVQGWGSLNDCGLAFVVANNDSKRQSHLVASTVVPHEMLRASSHHHPVTVKSSSRRGWNIEQRSGEVTSVALGRPDN